jgi:hypothetical protein
MNLVKLEADYEDAGKSKLDEPISAMADLS